MNQSLPWHAHPPRPIGHPSGGGEWKEGKTKREGGGLLPGGHVRVLGSPIQVLGSPVEVPGTPVQVPGGPVGVPGSPV